MQTAAHLPTWVESASVLPIAFAQVREDPLIDLAVIERIGKAGAIDAMMIASGGCTAASLVASGKLARLHMVDANPAQIALTRLKLYLLAKADCAQRLELLGHLPLAAEERGDRLQGVLAAIAVSPDALGPLDFLAEHGPDYAGRYERLFAELQQVLQSVGAELAALLTLDDPAEQTRRTRPGDVLGDALDAALDRVMALPNLVRLFGAAATQNSRQPFARHFADRIRAALAAFPAAKNPFLHQMLGGGFPSGECHHWLSAAPPARWPRLSWSRQTMDAALRRVREPVDFLHLSNILDWLSQTEAAGTLALAAGALHRGGYVLIRQLNSTLDIPTLAPQFDWLKDKAQGLHAQDRSFFYQAIHLGRKR